MNEKLKGFGLIESLVASFIILVVIGAAVGLASSSARTSSRSISRIAASDISKSIMEKLIFLNNADLIDFEDLAPDGKISYKCLDTAFLSGGQENEICTDNSSSNRLSPYYPYIIQGDNFNPKSIEDKKIIIENKIGKFDLAVNIKVLSSSELVADISVSWLDTQGETNLFSNRIGLTK